MQYVACCRAIKRQSSAVSSTKRLILSSESFKYTRSASWACLTYHAACKRWVSTLLATRVTFLLWTTHRLYSLSHRQLLLILYTEVYIINNGWRLSIYKISTIHMVVLTADVFQLFIKLAVIRVFAKVRFPKCTSLKIVPKAAFAVHF